MAIIHPNLDQFQISKLSDYAERNVLQLLQNGLPDEFEVFHSVAFSSYYKNQQHFGEIDALVLSPLGHLAILEVKAGTAVQVSSEGIQQDLNGSIKDISHQLKHQFSTWKSFLSNDTDFKDVKIINYLVLPDQKIEGVSSWFPRECIFDSTHQDQLCTQILRTISTTPLGTQVRLKLKRFIENKFNLLPDPTARIGKLATASRSIADGLATWVPRISHDSRIYQIQGTAGSGKTQLALALLKSADELKRKAAYICFNRPLADHIGKVVSHRVLVNTFHELCIEHYLKTIGEPDFTQNGVFEIATQKYREDCANFEQDLDLIIVDEAQDFDPIWIESIIARLKVTGNLYVMSDPEQELYGRESFDIADKVQVVSYDNFRSPRKVVDAINRLRLTEVPINPKSIFQGETPEWIPYPDSQQGGLKAIEKKLIQLLDQGFSPDQIVVLTYAGRNKSYVLSQSSIGKFPLTKFTGNYDEAGNALMTQGTILAETVYRFKGQSAPVILLCEIEFTQISQKDLKKLFVGFTRAQYHLCCLLNESAAAQILSRMS